MSVLVHRPPEGRPTWSVHFCGATYQGPARSGHQDAIVACGAAGVADGTVLAGSLLLGPADRLLFGVVDGVGGQRGGDLAASIVATDLARLGRDGFPADWNPACEAMSDRLGQAGRVWGAADMAATMAGLVVQRDGAVAFNVGDCRCYQVMDGYAGQVSIDDHDPSSPVNVVTQSLGGEPRVLDVHQLAVAHSDAPATRYVLSTDGLHGTLSADALREALVDAGRPDEVVGRLVAAAGPLAQDNFSLVVVDVTPGAIA